MWVSYWLSHIRFVECKYSSFWLYALFPPQSHFCLSLHCEHVVDVPETCFVINGFHFFGTELIPLPGIIDFCFLW